jgi:phenylpropionate dioxygenase-like ring-hydroxylating dioxygenase large terminal subunit
MNAILADEPTVVARIFRHIDAQSTDLSEAVWREPVANYISPARFEAEIARALRRTLTPFCPSAALPRVGSYVARDAAMTPILVVRGADGLVRAFRNACRHRGALIVDGMGCKAAFSCPYHAWTYGLDGRLRGVPHEHGFPGLDKATHGLAPVSAVERGGLVFVAQDEAADTEDQNEVPDLFGPEWRLIGAASSEIPVNWKIATEGVLEGYHIRATHMQTFYPRQYDNLTLVEHFGRNSRISFPFRSIEKQRNAPPEALNGERALTYLYHFFPNAAVATFPTHRQMIVFEPLAVDRTLMVSYTLTRLAADEPGRTSLKQGSDFVNAGLEEDRAVQIAVQRGLAARANEVFTFGLFEGAIRHFHLNLADVLAAA